MPPTILQQLESSKDAGNKLYSAGKYSAARDVYTEAISLLPSSGSSEKLISKTASIIYSNRAMAAKALGDWESATHDARCALSFDRLNAKGHYVLGLALRAAGSFAHATARLERAADMARRQKRGAALEAQFEGAAAAARAAWWAADADAQERSDVELHAAVVRALAAQPAEALRVSLPRIGDGECAPYSATALPAIDDSALASSASADEGYSAAAAVVAAARSPRPAEASALERLDALFAARRAERYTRGDVPQWAQDPVTFDVMLDPVVAPSGMSYERSSIEACLKMKPECPVSRVPLAARDLVPNVGLKAAIRAWLSVNPWAHPAAEAE